MISPNISSATFPILSRDPSFQKTSGNPGKRPVFQKERWLERMENQPLEHLWLWPKASTKGAYSKKHTTPTGGTCRNLGNVCNTSSRSTLCSWDFPFQKSPKTEPSPEQRRPLVASFTNLKKGTHMNQQKTHSRGFPFGRSLAGHQLRKKRLSGVHPCPSLCWRISEQPPNIVPALAGYVSKERGTPKDLWFPFRLSGKPLRSAGAFWKNNLLVLSRE